MDIHGSDRIVNRLATLLLFDTLSYRSFVGYYSYDRGLINSYVWVSACFFVSGGLMVSASGVNWLNAGSALDVGGVG